MSHRMLRPLLCSLTALALVRPAVMLAQQQASPSREPQRFIASALLGSAGAAGGFLIGAAVAPREGGLCPAVPGTNCGGGTPNVFGVMAGSALGAAAGATLGARLFGGRQNFLRSAGGALLGLFVGGAIASGRDADSDGALAVAFVVPAGALAAWVGR